jgi:hypothetical protein
VYVTRGFHALALDFALAVDDDVLGKYLEWLLDGFAAPPGDAVAYEVVTAGDEPDAVDLRFDGETVLHAAGVGSFVVHLVQWVNQRAVDPAYFVTSHAGGVVRDGLACVLPAHMEFGKTTLTAGLVRSGWSYLTDEAVAFDWETGDIEPFPKPLSVDPGSQHLFPELAPPRPPNARTDDVEQWQVPPSMFRADAVGARCRAGYVVFPRYAADAPTALVPIGRAEGLVELARNTFRFNEQPRRSLDALARVIRSVDCYRLTVGDLDTACRLVDALVPEGGNG